MTTSYEFNIQLPVRIRRVAVDRSGHWLAQGWHDVWRAPAISLAYGAAFVVVSYVLTLGLFNAGLPSLILPLAGGFVLIAPILVIGLYEVSRRLDSGEPITFGAIWTKVWSRSHEIGSISIIMLLFLFVWTTIAVILFALFYHQGLPMGSFQELVLEMLLTPRGALFILVGSIMGAVLATGIFTITAISIPMLMERDVDVVTAIVTSIVAVRRNRRTMFGWAAMIAVITFCSLACFFVPLVVALPTLAFATWRAYLDLISPSDT
ncbi:MAG: DUF2189 domain-containing protein [Rhodospirillales bacterium]